jgi:hypothetical protein
MLERGAGTFAATAGGQTQIVGLAGTLRKYCVQVEDGITTFTADEFAAVVDAILADGRSWIASRRWRFQRVPACEAANLRIRLTTPTTVDRLCASAGVDTEGQYSCRNRNDIFINLRRWTLGVPQYEGDLSAYRTMVINHETGHYLGFGHVFCREPGRLAAVMQQQSISLQGCSPNPFPYPDGVSYLG